MSVLVKGIKMPKNCLECEWGEYVGNGRAMCLRVGMTDDSTMMTEHRADFCPLVEVPILYGDLVDRDELLAEYDRQHKGPAGGARKIMEDAPTIIKAEERKI